MSEEGRGKREKGKGKRDILYSLFSDLCLSVLIRGSRLVTLGRKEPRMDTDTHGLLPENETRQIIGRVMEVLNALGHGLLQKPSDNLRMIGETKSRKHLNFRIPNS